MSDIALDQVQSLDDESEAIQQFAVLLGPIESIGHLKVFEESGPTRVSGMSRYCKHEFRERAPRGEREVHPPIGLERAPNALQHRDVVLDPVQGGSREN